VERADLKPGRRAQTAEALRPGSPDVLILGPYPPPLGGVSSNVQRLMPLLADAGVNARVLNHFTGGVGDPFVIGSLRRNPALYFLLPRRFRPSVVHYHHSRLSTLVAVALGRRRAARARYVVSVHSPNVVATLRSRVAPLRALTRWALGRFDEAIAVNERIAADLREALPGIDVTVIPDFLPPPEAAADELPREVERFLASSGRTLVVSAYRISFTRDGGDLYGLDTTIEAFAELACADKALRLAIFIGQPVRRRRDRAYLASLQARVRAVGLADRVLVVTAAPLTPAFRHDVVFVRPTRSDGDAVSIREALLRGVPVIASDIVGRAPGVRLVPVADAGALRNAVADALAAPPATGSPQVGSDNHYFDELLRIYQRSLLVAGGA
jgi:glycosyltransferase involved in cell wall biosynthesis